MFVLFTTAYLKTAAVCWRVPNCVIAPLAIKMTNASLNAGPPEGPLSYYEDVRTSGACAKAHLFGPAALAALKHAHFQSSVGRRQCSECNTNLIMLINNLSMLCIDC